MFRKNVNRSKLTLALIIAGLITGGLVLVIDRVSAAESAPAPVAQGSPLHPSYPLLDEDGVHVLESGKPVSTMQTCGSCHDATFIEQHSYHADIGLSDMTAPGEVEGGSEWDTSPGFFGEWDPLTYRYLSPEGDERIDLTTADWIKNFGIRHVGGGPALYGREGTRLDDLPANAAITETHIVDPETGELVPWDWEESGVVEMNCFLCHTPTPNNDARIETIHAGQFGWANTATLLGTGIVEQTGDSWEWNADAFDEDGNLTAEFVTIQDPTSENCSQCHGLVHVDAQTPLVMTGCTPDQWSTITTGQIISPQRLSDSGMNLTSKEILSRSWDVHAERVLSCTDCHYSLNNPVYFQESDATRPEHLTFDPRRIDIGEYLYRPLHQFAKGQSSQGGLAPELDNTLRRCESCHSIEVTHDWLPYKERHTEALSCETCHIPQMYTPARQSIDWTVINADGTPDAACRGIETEGETFSTALLDGFEPVLLPRQNADGTVSLAPHNLITSWFWVYGDPQRPVAQRDLEAAWLDGDSYHPDVMATFDADGNGKLDSSELLIDTDEKEALIASRLESLGLDNPRIESQVRPYTINHDVAEGDWAIKDCQVCHGEESRITQAIQLSDQVPGGVMPTVISTGTVELGGEFYTADDGSLYFQPATKTDSANLYVLGHNSVGWIDWAGIVIFLGTLGGVATHGGLRYFAARRRAAHEPELKRVYMYSVYERLWHWLQTLVIFILIFTGLIIHKPDMFGMFSFKYVVQVHNVMAAILVANAFLAAFYHLASGEIRQFLPEPHGFFNQAIEQAMFYLRGIFKGDEHPFEKTRDRKMNPLQQVTYLAILNVLLPLQVLTGLLMWGAQRWPDISEALGGLPLLGPAHSLIAWLFAAFIVMHVYLTTTGHEPLAGIKSMIMGWDEVEVHHQSDQSDQSDQPDEEVTES